MKNCLKADPCGTLPSTKTQKFPEVSTLYGVGRGGKAGVALGLELNARAFILKDSFFRPGNRKRSSTRYIGRDRAYCPEYCTDACANTCDDVAAGICANQCTECSIVEHRQRWKLELQLGDQDLSLGGGYILVPTINVTLGPYIGYDFEEDSATYGLRFGIFKF